MYWCKVTESEKTGPDVGRNLGVLEVPEANMMMSSIAHILGSLLGFNRSLEQRKAMLGDGRVVPMMSYALIEYLLSLDLSQFDVLELGGGNSTSFWSSKCKSVTTLETGADWVAKLRERNLPHTQILEVTAENLTDVMSGLGRNYDAIIIDASANRHAAAKTALQMLKPGGFVLLDNADWYPNTATLLREADLIQVDFPDFRPQCWFRCVTSLFLHPQFRARPLPGRSLPAAPIGGKNIADANNWDRQSA